MLKLEKLEIRHDRAGYYKRWRCQIWNCRKSVSILKCTLFENFNIGISKVLRILYMHCLGVKVKNLVKEFEINEKTIYSLIKKTKETAINFQRQFHGIKLGGENIIVEVDETHIVSRRDDRGRILKGERYWVFGVFERETKQIRLEVTRNRNANLCTNFVFKNIHKKTTVMTDRWRGYNRLNSCGYDHKTINNSECFVDFEDYLIHTQNIERLWRSFKENILGYNTFEQIKEYAISFEFDYNNCNNTGIEKFKNLILLNKL